MVTKIRAVPEPQFLEFARGVLGVAHNLGEPLKVLRAAGLIGKQRRPRQISELDAIKILQVVLAGGTVKGAARDLIWVSRLKLAHIQGTVHEDELKEPISVDHLFGEDYDRTDYFGEVLVKLYAMTDQPVEDFLLHDVAVGGGPGARYGTLGFTRYEDGLIQRTNLYFNLTGEPNHDQPDDLAQAPLVTERRFPPEALYFMRKYFHDHAEPITADEADSKIVLFAEGEQEPEELRLA